ncbi:hypothetical protein DID75_03110, partial [Candidatus Marinamargulisbacteria bacterium SCGC AG-410-N11]
MLKLIASNKNILINQFDQEIENSIKEPTNHPKKCTEKNNYFGTFECFSQLSIHDQFSHLENIIKESISNLDYEYILVKYPLKNLNTSIKKYFQDPSQTNTNFFFKRINKKTPIQILSTICDPIFINTINYLLKDHSLTTEQKLLIDKELPNFWKSTASFLKNNNNFLSEKDETSKTEIHNLLKLRLSFTSLPISDKEIKSILLLIHHIKRQNFLQQVKPLFDRISTEIPFYNQIISSKTENLSPEIIQSELSKTNIFKNTLVFLIQIEEFALFKLITKTSPNLITSDIKNILLESIKTNETFTQYIVNVLNKQNIKI